MVDQDEPGPGKPASSGGLPPSELAGFGVQFVIAILLFLYIGQWLDRRLGTAPWLMIVGIFLGAGGTFYSMFRKLTAKPKDSAPRPPRAP
jgi:F0F1-type ATP synthase assembly protein I